MRAGMSEKPKRWSDDAVFGGRAYFVFENEPGKLIVEKLQANDAGVYRCRVDFLRAQTYNSRLRLDIISKLLLFTQSITFSILKLKLIYFTKKQIRDKT